ncbi:UL9 [anatid alphaherpesvirus 1]|uniref:Replication origin-binding protein n=1 Tax=anatid alphaherpesvirus 1 TaxID=104388 RepID=C6ZD35_9ALPH|nr:UL9 [Anatid alphaherpesvirus 1]AHD45974.1 UL9 [BAC cloning vector pDEV-vac]ABY73923.1 DNA replication origin-binding helicase [Anatid alphaherpesvirus 1]ACT83566.1 UL9 [Anatid alphaherpesvirus 1]AFC61874.1 UL9 [Anatid alphaherpesvirus 1]AGA17845.1 UL9 [Anatid alphaherpesvirus 1]
MDPIVTDGVDPGSCYQDDRRATDDHTCSASLAKMLYGGDLIEWISRYRPGVTAEVQSTGPVSFPKPDDKRSRRVTVVRAPMGSGKTTALIEWLREILHSPDISALVVSCRRSFTHTLARRFNDAGLVGFVTYFTSSDYIMRGKTFTRLIVQIESLRRVELSLVDNYDVLILDEVMSTFAQLYSPTMRYLHQVDELMTRLIRHCPRIVAMDATVNAQLVELLADVRGDSNVHVIVGEYTSAGFADRACMIMRDMGVDTLRAALNPPSETTATQNMQSENDDLDAQQVQQPLRPDTFFAELGRRLSGGLNICIFSSTVSFSEIVAKFCLKYTDSIIVLNSTRPQQSDVTTWNQYRVLIYTTVVTVGLSFDESHFHSMFAYVKPMIHGPDMATVYQSLGRIRLLRLNEVLMYIDGSGARSDPIFTSMLLNHVVATGGGWPTKFSQVTNLLCCRFRDRCAPTFSESSRDLFLFSRLKYKHFFERCTLNSLNDSLNIMYALLESNRIRINLGGHEPSADEFCRLLSDIQRNSITTQRQLRALKKHGNGRLPPAVEVADSEEAAIFSEKYLRPDASIVDTTELLKAMASPIVREHFVNTVMIEACRRIPAAMLSETVFRRLYCHYGSGTVPTITNDGTIETVALVCDFNWPARWDLYRLCAKMADAIKLDLRNGGATVDLNLDIISDTLRPDYSNYIRLLLEVSRCNITEYDLVAPQPVREVQAALAGMPNNIRQVGPDVHAMLLFKVILYEMLGAHLMRSTRSFPGSVKVKNLKKEEIVTLLTEAGIDFSDCRTHKDLYARLMSHKNKFKGTRYRIKSPKWTKLLRSARDLDNDGWEPSLETVLADIPSEHWPRAEGAVDYRQL